MGIRSRHPDPAEAGGRGGGIGRLAALVALVAVTAGLLLVGCAESSAGRGSASGGTAATAGAGQVVVRGTVRNGVEPGCVLLDGQDKRSYLLLGAREGQLQAGARVEVVGQPVDQVASFCGEGSALSVVSVRPLGSATRGPAPPG